jgi:hypothetical protein
MTTTNSMMSGVSMEKLKHGNALNIKKETANLLQEVDTLLYIKET